MQNMRFVGVLVLLSLALSALTACGSDTPTATAVPPKPTNTVAVPTNTALPPSPTALLATATTAAPPATATTAAAPPAATGTTAAMPGTTGTPGAMTGGMPATTGTPGAMTGGMAATTDDLALITQSFTATAGLKSFHFAIQAAGTAITQPTTLEGDYVAPDQLYGKGTQSGETGEFLKAGTTSYKKDATGAWAPWTDPSAAGKPPMTPQQDFARNFTGFAGLATAADFRDTGVAETLDGVSTKHFVGQIALSKMPGVPAQVATMQNLPPAGTMGLWIDPKTKYLYKVELDLDMGAATAAIMNQLVTPVPGAPPATAGPADTQMVHLTLTKLGDPSITVPAAPAGGGAAAPTTAPAGGGAATPTTAPASDATATPAAAVTATP